MPLILKVKVLAGTNFYNALKDAKDIAEHLNVIVQFKFNGYRHAIGAETDIDNRLLTDGFNTQKQRK